MGTMGKPNLQKKNTSQGWSVPIYTSLQNTPNAQLNVIPLRPKHYGGSRGGEHIRDIPGTGNYAWCGAQCACKCPLPSKATDVLTGDGKLLHVYTESVLRYVDYGRLVDFQNRTFAMCQKQLELERKH